MRSAVLGLVVVALVGAGAAGFVWKQRKAPDASRERLVEQFVAILPDSLGDTHRSEIDGLFQMLWYRADRGLVAPVDLDSILVHLQDHVDAGSISGRELVRLMAEVGYKTYKGDPRYNLPSGEVDHPVLNPSSAMIQLRPDTTGFAEWLAEQKRLGIVPPEEGGAADTTGGR
jgi:hypothetical protein